MSAFNEVVEKASKEFGDMLGKAVKGKKVNGTYKAINHIGNNYFGGVEMANKVLGASKMGFKEAAIRTFANNADDVLKEGSKAAAKWNYGKIAGSYIGVSAAARVATGGGLYKDRNGNTNVAGVPFI